MQSSPLVTGCRLGPTKVITTKPRGNVIVFWPVRCPSEWWEKCQEQPVQFVQSSGCYDTHRVKSLVISRARWTSSQYEVINFSVLTFKFFCRAKTKIWPRFSPSSLLISLPNYLPPPPVPFFFHCKNKNVNDNFTPNPQDLSVIFTILDATSI